MVSEEKFFCPICKGISEEVITEILSFAQKVNFQNKHYIYNQGDSCKGFYIILEGTVRVSAQNEDGKEFYVKRLKKGDSFGASVIMGGNCLESAMTETDSVCVFVPQKEFVDLVSRDVSLSESMTKETLNWLLEFYNRLNTFSLSNVRDRVERYFVLESEASGENLISLSLKKHEIASNLGMRPETFSRVLSELQNEGAITIKNNIVDTSKIKQLTH